MVLAGCSPETPEITVEIPTYVEVYDTLIDQVKAQGGDRISRMSMDDMDWSKFPKADLQFINGVMLRSQNNNDTLPTDTSSVYHVYDFRDLDTLFVFSIVRNDVAGFSSLYHFTLNKLSKKLVGCTLIGSSRKVADYTCNDKLTYADDGRSLIANSNAEVREKGKTVIDQCSVRYDFYNDRTTRKLLHNVHRERPKR